jgi:hypothetical protein
VPRDQLRIPLARSVERSRGLRCLDGRGCGGIRFASGDEGR